ncbi:MAG: FAD/FMN-dependent dehydrogenase [Mucilaginibacter sp.]|uniref:FAD-binding and (Fe-S)-binding domain-containing protein n=1 Tax=Mucilaginibacter sp. TaxID=1882438 RepID=UPI002620D36C|nr:FAD-binding and (Fe-S)-binding domain-containing protein [Mucilaginibacter sp.]MDB5002038.1 FAD/FMN-dependent dehydrogenase [Mucilaginibacter sp.]
MAHSNIGKLLEAILPADRIKTNLIDLVASASDAGFYYLRPQAVVLPVSEDEVIKLFAFSKQHKIPLVFRTAGTSLSGQSITDGILVDLSQHWNKITIENDGQSVRVRPGAIGANVNTYLKKYQRKIGPDPASINAAMMGGIISNNASGMCCGVSKNSYHTTKYLRFILPNGKTFSTESPIDYERFQTECADLYDHLKLLRLQILNNPEVYDKIRKKYQTKNTVGYSVNAFIDYEEPMDILAHLLIGAEGTLGFIAEAVLETVNDYPEKLTAMLYFTDIYSACKAITPLTTSGAAAVELMDRASLQSIENIEGMPAIIKTLPENAAALLVEYQGNTQDELKEQMADFLTIADDLSLLQKAEFTAGPYEQALFWKVRKGMFPAVGAVRASGTSVILEDIAFPVDSLGDAISDLQLLFKKHGYTRAIIFGHAKDGNIHFVVTQAFDTSAEVERYRVFLQDVVDLVVKKYNGALKAEHGTGRNMAPFVETEWGGEIYRVMKTVKEIIDPENLLNPGVIINADKNAHIKNLKELPQVEEEVDRCIECGFCEHKCPSRDITLTPRKRIVVRRELLNLKNKGNKAQHDELLHQYQYQGLDTCAVDGLCATACPVDINTGDLVKRLRRENHSSTENKLALFTAKNFKSVYKTVRFALASGILINKVFGPKAMFKLTKTLRKVMPSFPLWSNQLALAKAVPRSAVNENNTQSVVYFPACISRAMGECESGQKGVMQTFMDVSAKAGINVIIPTNIEKNCCGQIYSSKGFKDAYTYTVNATVDKLWFDTSNGKFPVVLDISSCTQTLTHCRPALSEENKIKFDQLQIIDSITYIHDYVMPNISVTQKKTRITLHPVCSLQKMPGLESKFSKIAATFATNINQPVFAGCCGMAGDRGFLHPELTHSATLPEANEVKANTYDGYYSSSKTCEIALSEAVGKNYHSILMLVDECTGIINLS